MTSDKKNQVKPAEKNEPAISWSPWLAIIVTIAIFIGSQFLAGFLVALYPFIRGLSVEATLDWFTYSSVAQFLTVFITAGLMVWFLWLFLKRNGRDFKAIGLVRFKLKDLLFTLQGVAAYIPALYIVFTLVSVLVPTLNTEQEQQIGFEAADSKPELALVFISLAILPAIVEELLTRGFLYTSLRSKWPLWTAVLVTSALFALPHLEFGTGASLVWMAAIDTFVLSLVLIWLKERSGSLWPGIVLHFVKNSVAFIVLFIVS